MLYCGDRAFNATWLSVASADQGVGAPVEMYWFHELPAPIPLDQPPASDPVGLDRFKHYTQFDPNVADRLSAQANNWHYIGSPTNDLVPLKSLPWPDGEPRKRLGGNRTNLFACHGTSGSGVLQRNASTGNLELVGPALGGDSKWAERLCVNPGQFVKTDTGMTYTSNQFMRQMQSKFSRQLLRDRNPVTGLP
jgi:hypothetical protein